MNKWLSSAAFLLILFSLQPAQVLAAITICMHPGDCYAGDGSCDGWCPDPPAYPTCAAALKLNPSRDFILAQKNHAWLVTVDKKIPLVSDKFSSFLSKIKSKYAKANTRDKKVQARIQAEFTSFLKTDDGTIGAKRLALISKETGLKVREGDKKP